MAIIKTIDLTGPALDWAVDAAETGDPMRVEYKKDGSGVWMLFDKHGMGHPSGPQKYSQDWKLAGPIIDAAQISTIRCDDDYEVDDDGFTTDVRIPVWAAVLGERHSIMEQYGSQGDCFGSAYEVNADAICGPTPLVAAMRCYVASKLGDQIDIPLELIA